MKKKIDNYNFYIKSLTIFADRPNISYREMVKSINHYLPIKG